MVVCNSIQDNLKVCQTLVYDDCIWNQHILNKDSYHQIFLSQVTPLFFTRLPTRNWKFQCLSPFLNRDSSYQILQKPSLQLIVKGLISPLPQLVWIILRVKAGFYLQRGIAYPEYLSFDGMTVFELSSLLSFLFCLFLHFASLSQQMNKVSLDNFLSKLELTLKSLIRRQCPFPPLCSEIHTIDSVNLLKSSQHRHSVLVSH